MTKSELIEQIAMRQPELSAKEVETAVRIILDDMTDALASGGRVEIRGFGSFSLHYESLVLGATLKQETRSTWTASMCRTSNRAKSCANRCHAHLAINA